MVIERSIDVDDTDEDYMDGESDEGIFFEDDDLQNEFQAPTLINPRQKKAAKFTVPWKALRLPAAQGEGRFAALTGLFAGSKNIRSSPYAYVIPYKSWQQYISNMDATDVAAEMNAPVSDFEKASLYLFAEEWRLDVTHEAFKRRLIDHPLVNVAQETAKGQLVFDIVTGKVTAKGGRPDTKHEEMLRLAMDILQSIRLRYYTYYSVNLLHGHEGAAVYEEFLSRYVPLEAQEVAIIAEIEMGIRAQGRSYAVNTSNPMADAVTTFNLMMRVVESYNIGDTMTARAGISALLQAPINYRSSARHTVNTDSLGRSGIVTSGNIVGIAFQKGDQKEAKKGTKVHYMLKKALNSDEELPSSGRENQLKSLFNGKHWVEVKGVNDSTPINVWSTRGGSKLNSQSYEDYLNLGAAAQAVQETLSPARTDRPKRGSVKLNPNHGNEQMALDYLRGRPYGYLLNLDEMRSQKAALMPENPYLMFGSNGFYVFGDAYANRLGEPGVSDVASYLRAFPTEDAVFYLGGGWLPLGRNVKANPSESHWLSMDPNFQMGLEYASAKEWAQALANRDQKPWYLRQTGGRWFVSPNSGSEAIQPSVMSNPDDSERYPWRLLLPLRDTRYGHLATISELNEEKSRLTEDNPYLMFGSNGFYVFGDAYAARLGEPGVTDVASYLRVFPDEVAVFVLNETAPKYAPGMPLGIPFPFGKPGVMSNPVAIGKGQHFFIQLRPKSQFSFNAKQKKMGATAKGSMTVVGTPGRDSTGFVDLFGGFEDGGYVAWKGTHKDSGSSKAWVVQLPRKYGKGKSRGKGGDTVFKAARVTDKKTGKSYRTIKPFTADKKIKAAWDKFVALYGEPVFADDPKRPNLFRIRRQGRGTYYKRK